MRLIDWILGLFGKKEEEVTFEKVELAVEAWPFPVPAKKKRPQVKKATTRKVKPAAKKPAAKKPAVKKTTKKAK